MKVLFICNLLQWEVIERDPLGVLYCASALKKAGHEVELVDISSFKHVSDTMRSFSPEVVGYTLRTGYHRYPLKLNKALKKQFCFLSVFGGAHATFFPEVIQEDGVDAVCIGEGEEALVDLLGRIENGSAWYNVPNWWIKHRGLVYRSRPRGLVQDLDSLPFPDRTLLRKYRILRNRAKQSFLASRGCPFRCTYCFNHVYRNVYGNRGPLVRRRSVPNLIAEIKSVLVEEDIRIINFEDDMFIFDKTWLEEFSASFKREIHIPFICFLRPDMVDQDTVGLLKEAGCISASLGVETGDDRVRYDILHRRISNADIIRASELIRQAGIRLFTQNMLGIPGGTLSSDLETLRLNMRCKPDYPLVSLCQPYPKTELCRFALQRGLFSHDFDTVRDYNTASCLKLDNKREVENLQKLFGMVTSFPVLFPFVRFLIALPLGRLYAVVFSWWRAYCGYARIHMIRLRLWAVVTKVFLQLVWKGKDFIFMQVQMRHSRECSEKLPVLGYTHKQRGIE